MTASAAPAAAGPPAAPSNGSLPLARKLPLLILAILTLVLGASLAISYYEVRRSAQLSAGDRLSRLSHSLASLMEQQTSTKLGLMRRISTDSAVQAAFSTPNRAPSAAAIRTMSAIRLPSDSLTPP